VVGERSNARAPALRITVLYQRGLGLVPTIDCSVIKNTLWCDVAC